MQILKCKKKGAIREKASAWLGKLFGVSGSKTVRDQIQRFRPEITPRRHQATTVALLTLVAPLLVLLAPDAMAGSGGTEFQTIYQTLSDWIQGILGRVISICFVIVGLVAGVVRGSIMGFVFGIASGVGLFVTPTILDNIVTATI
ncbi:TraA family conjugative transfer protein [Methylocaldum szegediense]|jgi:conjugal transfer pilus assembly protein TraA|uniref:TraA family conjugative transfer protein n=1 Tax=Methylocaldum szegediense TaxID=73780 RepID=UPI00042A12A9|nr:TraA family conjugative transfer protein [Methylocaldum szegediense]